MKQVLIISFLIILSITINAQKTIVLNPITIHSKKIKPKYIGSPKKNKSFYGFSSIEPHHQLALKIDNKNHKLYKKVNLISVSIRISPSFGIKNNNGNNQLRLRIYEMNTEGEIGKEILQEKLFIATKKSNGHWYKMTLKNLFILPDNGFFIATEWLENLNSKKIKFYFDNYKKNKVYGPMILGYTFKEKSEKLKYYSTWRFYPKKNKWKKEIRYPYLDNTIPAFRLEIKEY